MRRASSQACPRRGAAALLGTACAVAVAVPGAAGDDPGTRAPCGPRSSRRSKVVGLAREGETLVTDGGSWSGTEPMSRAFQWRRCDLEGNVCQSITDATGQDSPADRRRRGSDGPRARHRHELRGRRDHVVRSDRRRHPALPELAAARKVGTATAPEATGPRPAASRRNPGLLWAHNDSGDTERGAGARRAGAPRGIYSISAKSQSDWEDMAVGPGPVAGASYLYLGAIGANTGRHWLYVYRAPEPAASPTQAPVSALLESVVKLPMRYPGEEEYNAEALMVDPLNHDIYVVTKKWNGWAKVFRYPAEEQNLSRTYELQAVRTLSFPGPVTAADSLRTAARSRSRDTTTRASGRVYSGQAVGAALAAPSCQISHGPGETIAFAANGGGYFTIAEGRSKPLYWFGRS